MRGLVASTPPKARIATRRAAREAPTHASTGPRFMGVRLRQFGYADGEVLAPGRNPCTRHGAFCERLRKVLINIVFFARKT